MVEFGLKLEDNKVAEWSVSYIDYEKLKAILKKAKNARKKLDDLTKRRPELAAEIQRKYQAGIAQSNLPSYNSLSNLAEVQEDRPMPATNLVDSVPSGHNENMEMTGLLHTKKENYGSNRSLHSGEEATHDSFSGQLRRAVSGYFSKSKYETNLRDTLREIDDQHAKFDNQLFVELDKVNSFYKEKLEELRSRYKFLAESVGSSVDLAHIAGSKEKGVVRKRVAELMKRILQGDEQHQQISDELEETRQLLSPDDDDDESDNEVEHGGEDATNDKKDGGRTRSVIVRESDSVKRALVDQYRTAKLLHNFSIMNYTGFVKIIKKHDKTFPEHKGLYKESIKEKDVCNEGKEVLALIDRMEKAYAAWFCDGNVREAQVQMLPKRGDGLQMDWSQLRLGYRLGMCAILALWVCWDCIWGYVSHGESTIGGRTAFPVFRACGGLLLLHWLWGMSVFVWTRYRINYIFLFDLNPKIVDTPIVIFNDAVDETLVFLISMLLYYKSGAHDIPQWVPAGYYPFLLLVYTALCLVFPWRTRAPMWSSIWEVITTPLTEPTFFTIYIADVFTSMIKVFQDIVWSICFVVSGDFMISEDRKKSVKHLWQHSVWYKNILIPLICLFPLWIRFNQCLRRYLETRKRMPNLANAFKYALSQTVTLFGTFHPLYLMKTRQVAGTFNYFQIFWTAIFVSSSLYSFWWDVRMDWGLGRIKQNLLGPRLMFPKRWYYYGVMAADLVLRSMWVLTLLPPDSGAKFEIPAYLTAVTMALELVRRTLWGFFRLENEHRNNTEHYRRVDFVPLHFNTGHKHKYSREREHVGWSVLAEVAAVTLIVIAISVTSVIAAQRAARNAELAASMAAKMATHGNHHAHEL